MRRLSELLTFPKPWYRKLLIRRLFFGEQSVAVTIAQQQQPRFGRKLSGSTVSPTPHFNPNRKNSFGLKKIPLGHSTSGSTSAVYVKPM